MDQDAIAIMIRRATILGINVFLATVGTYILAEPKATGSGHCLPSGLFRGNRPKPIPQDSESLHLRQSRTTPDRNHVQASSISKTGTRPREKKSENICLQSPFLVHRRFFTGTGPTVLRFACHNVRGIGVKFREFLPPVSLTFQLRQA
jgi:hypothetical protein